MRITKTVNKTRSGKVGMKGIICTLPSLITNSMFQNIYNTPRRKMHLFLHGIGDKPSCLPGLSAFTHLPITKILPLTTHAKRIQKRKIRMDKNTPLTSRSLALAEPRTPQMLA
jgi:hypothetical protein